MHIYLAGRFWSQNRFRPIPVIEQSPALQIIVQYATGLRQRPFFWIAPVKTLDNSLASAYEKGQLRWMEDNPLAHGFCVVSHAEPELIDLGRCIHGCWHDS